MSTSNTNEAVNNNNGKVATPTTNPTQKIPLSDYLINLSILKIG